MDKSKFHCGLCSSGSFVCLRDYHQHFGGHLELGRGKKLNGCKYCKFSTDNALVYRRHVQDHVKIKDVKHYCSLCSRRYYAEYAWQLLMTAEDEDFRDIDAFYDEEQPVFKPMLIKLIDDYLILVDGKKKSESGSDMDLASDVVIPDQDNSLLKEKIDNLLAIVDDNTFDCNNLIGSSAADKCDGHVSKKDHQEVIEERDRLKDRIRLMEDELKLLKEHYPAIVREKNAVIGEKNSIIHEKNVMIMEKESAMRSNGEFFRQKLEDATGQVKGLVEEVRVLKLGGLKESLKTLLLGKDLDETIVKNLATENKDA